MRRLVLLIVLGVPASAAAQDREALLLGSSSVNGAVGRTVERELASWGVHVSRRYRSSSGFARPDYYDWQEQVSRLGELDRYALIVIIAGGNDAQSLWLRPEERTERRQRWLRWRDEDRWREIYAERVRAFIDALCEAGAPRVAVLLPANGGRHHWSRRIVRVREAQAAGARASRCGRAIDCGPETFDAVDGVHLSRNGANRMWARVEESFRELLGERRRPDG